jgi:UDP-N-acetylglucosamine transferase subunit ALG13
MLGYKKVLLQVGAGEVEPTESTVQGITVDSYRFKSSIKEDIDSADLVISHAGIFEQHHDKTNIMGLRPAWIQTSLSIRAV